MKTIQNLFIVITALLLFSCEETVTVDLENAAPRLVVDASIQWIKGTSGNNQVIKLSTTTGYYNQTVPRVSGATVLVSDDTTTYTFTEIPNTGDYVCNNFIPVIGKTYVLTILYQNQTYTATETLTATPDIEPIIEQNNQGGFTGEDIELKFFYQDNPLEDNFYRIEFQPNFKTFPEYAVVEDRFFQGNQMFGFYTNEDLKAGDQVNMQLMGISQAYFNYLRVLLSVAGTNSGGPFQAPPATVRGNITNQTNENNYALGYFNLAEIDKRVYTVQ